MNCCICNEKIGTQTNGWDKGHNAEPIGVVQYAKSGGETKKSTRKRL